jgi:capsular exopolysaccharide synthesis family protein
MEIKSYINPLLKYWWLLLSASVVAFLSSYMIMHKQPAIYQTHSTLIIGSTIFSPNPNASELYLNQQLASYYVDMAYRQAVQNATMSSLGLQWLPEYHVQNLSNTSLIEIDVIDTNPLRSQAVANELANQLVKLSPSNSQSNAQDHQTFINQQLSDLETQINATKDEITKQQAQLGSLNSAKQIADTQSNINALTTKLLSLQTIYSNLLLNTNQGASNVLSVVEYAPLPTFPIGPQRTIMVLLSTVIALVIAAGAAYLLEYLDDTLKDPEDINKVLNLPVLGSLSEVKQGQNEAEYVEENPRSAIAEAFRTLRTNLEFVAIDQPLDTILITSPGVSEGKTSVATNLAIVMAQGGKSVVLLDADMRSPSIHEVLKVSNSVGLSDLFRSDANAKIVTNEWKDGILIVTAGKMPPNPTDLLGSQRMDSILKELKDLADIVIIDGPPSIVIDASVLSAKVNGVLLVIRHSITRKGAARATLDQLKRSGAKVLGVAINRIPRSGERYIGSYRYFDKYYVDDQPITPSHRILQNIMNRLKRKMPVEIIPDDKVHPN